MNIIGKRKIWFSISGITILFGILAILIWHLKFGLDFTGGTLLELSFDKIDNIEVSQIKDVSKDLDFTNNMIVQKTGAKQVLIRTSTLDNQQVNKLEEILGEKVGESREIRLETVGPTVSNNLKSKAIIAFVIASLAIIFYVALAFRSVPKPANSWRFGICAIIALIHDLLVAIGIYAILGHYLGYEVDSLFITALLTIMGFSVHDTIVVFDRIRENLKRYPSKDFHDNVNISVNQTLTRSLNTSLTVIIVLLSLLLLGGKSIQHFIAILLIGVTIGTYSSIFTASPILVAWQNWSMKKSRK